MAKPDRLIYLALGGAGEIGMNTYLYGYGPAGSERFILVDLGVTFPTMENAPGVDLIMADIAWIQARVDRLDGIFITHAHEDHVGALGLLHSRLKAPIHARRFTAAIAQNKMERASQDPSLVRQAAVWPHRVQAGPFSVSFVPVAHSIPECSSLLIETPAGRILHTADFKTDANPVVGEAFDPELFREIGDLGVRAMTCDSTNIFSSLPGRSESGLAGPLQELIASAEGMVVATTFASNVARLKTLAEAGRAAGREIIVLGRAMNTMLKTAKATEILGTFPPTLDPLDADSVPRSRLLVLATGSQGERRAASAQLAAGKYMGIDLRAGDTFLFSSKTIPGNEVSVARILNQLSARGVRAIEDGDGGRYHVSGHANRPDLARMHDLVRPEVVIPMHGEHRHLSSHADLARELGRPAVIAPNGAVVEIAPGAPRVVEHIETGRTYLDGSELIGALDGVVRDRLRLAMRGHVTVSVLIDEAGKPTGGSWAECRGLAEPKRLRDGLSGAIESDIDRELLKMKRAALADDEEVEDAINRIVARVCNDRIGKKPMVTVLISRLEP
jgi:ribonuclease J